MSHLFHIPTEAMLQGLPTTMTAHKFVTIEWVLQTLNGGPDGQWSVSKIAELMTEKDKPVWYGTPVGRKGPWVYKTTPGVNDKITAIASSSVQAIFENALGLMIDVLNINPANERSIKAGAKTLHILAYALKHKLAGIAVVKIVDGGIKIIPLINTSSAAVFNGEAATTPVEEVVDASQDVVAAEAPPTMGLGQIVTPATEEEIAKAAQFAMRRERMVNELAVSDFNNEELEAIVAEAIARRKKDTEAVAPITLVPKPTKVEAIIKRAKEQFSEHRGWFIIRNASTLEDVKAAYKELRKSGRDVAFGSRS